MGSSQSKQTPNEAEKTPKRNKEKKTPRNSGGIRVAVTGRSGVGKSSFVNAIRGVNDDGCDAAPVGVVETTKQPTEYELPSNGKISFVDMPPFGAMAFPHVVTFFEKLNLESYDAFVILVARRITTSDFLLAEKLKRVGKPMFFVRTKIDLDITSAKRRSVIRTFVEMELLKEIRHDFMRNLYGVIQSENQVFLISNLVPDKWDFERLIQAISAELLKLPCDFGESISFSPKATDEEEENDHEEREAVETKEMKQLDEIPDLTAEYLADAKEYIKKNGVSGIDGFVTTKLNGWKNVKIRFGITGDSGTGKSSFINAIRGLQDDDYKNNAAKVGVTETTRERKVYRHPDNPMISLVDLPGIGTPNYPDLKTYCRKVDFESYDTFLIFTKTRFTADDLNLAKKVKSLGKSFFLIRSSIDVDLMPKPRKAIIDEEATLQEIRNDCIENVRGMISSDEIFLISNYDKEKWDFDRLVKAIAEALPVLQRESLILSLSNLTRGCLKSKANFLKVRAVAMAVISAGNGAIPLPGWRPALDAALVKDTIADYYKQLGIPDLTSDNFERFHEFEDVIRRYSFRSNDGEVISTLESEALGWRKVQDVSKYIPIVGTIVAGSISFSLTLHYLLRCVNELEELALAVWDEAANKNKSI